MGSLQHYRVPNLAILSPHELCQQRASQHLPCTSPRHCAPQLLETKLIEGIATNEEAISLQPAWLGSAFSPCANNWILMSLAEKHSHASRSCFRSAFPMQMQADLMKGEIKPNWHSRWSIQHRDIVMTALISEGVLPQDLCKSSRHHRSVCMRLDNVCGQWVSLQGMQQR